MSDLTLPVDIKAPDGTVVGRIEMGAAEGAQFPTIRLFKGDIINVRNVQGGTSDSPNLDLGAGDSDQHRGNIVLNWDVGHGVGTYDGHKKLVHGVNLNGNGRIESRLPHRFYRGALVRRADGSWRSL